MAAADGRLVHVEVLHPQLPLAPAPVEPEGPVPALDHGLGVHLEERQDVRHEVRQGAGGEGVPQGGELRREAGRDLPQEHLPGGEDVALPRGLLAGQGRNVRVRDAADVHHPKADGGDQGHLPVQEHLDEVQGGAGGPEGGAEDQGGVDGGQGEGVPVVGAHEVPRGLLREGFAAGVGVHVLGVGPVCLRVDVVLGHVLAVRHGRHAAGEDDALHCGGRGGTRAQDIEGAFHGRLDQRLLSLLLRGKEEGRRSVQHEVHPLDGLRPAVG
mmetsp:Transcript_29060/g.52216  ORF Transcript_29060/g.52216 Transcript_29060/m.52216 type:complete len:269 (-) Transcript_29060:193-999(-)